MNKRKIPVLLILGIALVLLSLGAVLTFQLQMAAVTDRCEAVAAQMAQLLPERRVTTSQFCPDTAMPVLQIDGEDYAALLELPAFGLALPVADRWQGGDVIAAPSRFWGSAYTDTLVVGGKDHPGQFDFCSKIELGTVVTVTDMTGQRFTYSVARVDRAQTAESSWLLAEEFALTLFCRDTYSMQYIAVRCQPA